MAEGEGTTGPAWERIDGIVRQGMREGVKHWTAQTMVLNGTVQTTSALVPPGGLGGAGSFEAALLSSLLQAEVSTDIARALSSRLWTSWKAWADGFTIHIPGLFPMFANYPGPVAPPTPGVGMTPVSQGNSTGAPALTGVLLGSQLQADVPGSGVGDRQRALGDLADWVENSFQRWSSMAYLQGHRIMGTGPVPSFVPRHVPAGPVVGGRLVPGGPGVISAVDFGVGVP